MPLPTNLTIIVCFSRPICCQPAESGTLPPSRPAASPLLVPLTMGDDRAVTKKVKPGKSGHLGEWVDAYT